MLSFGWGRSSPGEPALDGIEELPGGPASTFSPVDNRLSFGLPRR